MKFFYIIFSLFVCTSCSSLPVKNSLNYSKLKIFDFSSTTKKDVIDQLGQPDDIIFRNNHQTLLYNDKVKKYHRASINISTSTNLVTGYVWVPFPNEKEFKIDTAMSDFDKASFKETEDPNTVNAHYISYTVQLVDERNGITIMYNKSTKSVDAIAFFNKLDRTTSSH